MDDKENLSFGQRIDPENGLVECWFTWGALDEIKSMDLTDKNIMMLGAGLGDYWLSRRCKNLLVIERNEEWMNKALYSCRGEAVITNLVYSLRPCNDSDGKAECYLFIPDFFQPDIIISDDAYRTEAVRMAIDYFKKREEGGILICDNYWQDFVWKSPIAIEWLEPFEKHIHLCTTHTDHEGDAWKTAIIFIK